MLIAAGLLVAAARGGVRRSSAGRSRRRRSRPTSRAAPHRCGSRSACTAGSSAPQLHPADAPRPNPSSPGGSAQRPSATAELAQAGSGSAPVAVSTCAHTWSAPASRWAVSRAATVAASPCGDERVDQRVAAAVGDVGVGPAEPQQVGPVVAQVQVGLVDGGPADRAGALGSVSSTTFCSGASSDARAERSRAPRGCARAWSGRGARPRSARRPARSTFGPSAASARPDDRHLGVVQPVQVVDDRVVRAAVLLGGLGVPDADAEQEPAGCAAAIRW